MNPVAEGGILLFQTKRPLLLLAFILIFSALSLPDHSFAASPYKIEINKATNHLYLYKNNQVIKIFRVGTGKEKSLTPEGLFTIGSRAENPVWRDSENNRIVPGGHKDNPLGKFWLGIKVSQNDRAQTYGIHGTNDESTIPGHVSKGCIRMKNADIQLLYEHYKIPIGTPVWIHSGTSTQKWLDNKPKEEQPKEQPKEKPKEESKEEPKKEEIKNISGKIITTARVNIRQGLSTSTAILNKVEKDTILTVTGETSAWYRVNFNGKIGFIAKNYAKRFEGTANLQQKADSKTDPAAQSLQADIKTSLTKDESLKIDVSLSNAKKASGTWKITLNNQEIVNEKSEQTTYTHIHKNPKLDSKQIKLTVEFNGTIDEKKVNGVKEVTYNKVEEKMSITPTFKDNQFQLLASLKGSQKAEGIWIIQLGKTQRVIPQSGEKLDEIFKEVTFNKKHFPVKVEFKGFLDTSFVIARYEKNLKVNLSKINLDQTGSQANVEENDESEDNDEIVSNQEDSNENTNKEQSDNQNNGTQDIANGSQETKENVVAYNEDQIDSSATGKVVAKDEKSNEEENSTKGEEPLEEEDSTKQKGGKLPKTATNYPIGILFGIAMIIIGTWMIRFFRANRAS